MIKIAFLGDISFNDQYIDLYEQGKNPFAKISSFLHDQDLVVGNLECIAEGNSGGNELKKPRLKTTANTLEYLKELNVKLVTLANNHVYDNLDDGFRNTINYLEANSINSIGAGLEIQDAGKPFFYYKDGLKFCFLSFLTPDTNPCLPQNAQVFLNIYNEETIIKEIQLYKTECDYLFLLLHWGGRFEGGGFPDYYQISSARAFIKAGAHAIIGHHSHTLQPFESISGKMVFYSLGNFCFSDIHFEGKKRSMSEKKFTESVIPVFQFTKEKSSLALFPIKNENLYIEEKKQILRKLHIRNFFFFFIRFKFFWRIYYFSFKYIRPFIRQLKRKDEKKSLLKRIFTLNKSKFKQLIGYK